MSSTADLFAISSSAIFQGRVTFAMTKRALARFDDTPTADERALIQRVLTGNGPLAQWALAAVTDATIAAGTHTLDGATITDSQLDSAVTAMWPALVG